jgi:hypothetical protein
MFLILQNYELLRLVPKKTHALLIHICIRDYFERQKVSIFLYIVFRIGTILTNHDIIN